MNRPLKFRVWDHILSEWIKSDQLVLRPNGSITDGSILIDSKYIQFNTSLNDKYGKEIYEGDIVIDTQSQKYAVFANEKYGKYDIRVCGAYKQTSTIFFTQMCDKKYIEVIGNIFEHKHLLEK